MNILSNSTLPTPRVAQGTFTDSDWAEVIEHLTEVIGAEAARYAAVPAAKLTAAIPYLAGSEDPDRFAVSNLLTFHAATKARSLFNHRPSDDESIFRRLAAFHVGEQADPKVVEYGVTILALISLGDHENDAQDDAKAGKYNPVNAGQWNVGQLRDELESFLTSHPEQGERFKNSIRRSINFAVWA